MEKSRHSTTHKPTNRKMCRLFVGGLNTTSKIQLEQTFGRFGELTEAWVARHPPGFAFVAYLRYVSFLLKTETVKSIKKYNLYIISIKCYKIAIC